MVLSEETLDALYYFFIEKDVYSWTGWEDNKEQVLQELPLLRIYLEKERELHGLGRGAVKRELEELRRSEA